MFACDCVCMGGGGGGGDFYMCVWCVRHRMNTQNNLPLFSSTTL